jgi:hypothetical protein
MADSHNPAQKLVLQHPRVSGAAILAFGGVLCYLTVFQPLQEASAGAAKVEISAKGATAGVVLAVLGVSFLCFGLRCAKIFMPAAEESKKPAYIAGVVFAVIGLGIYFGLISYLQGCGYAFQY